MNHPRIAFLDVETTGLDPETDHVIEYAVQLWAWDAWRAGKLRGAAYSKRVMPPTDPTPEAAAVNGFTREAWARAKPFSGFDATTLATMLDGAIIAGANPAFDRAFVAAEARRLGFEPPKWSHRSIDVQSLAAPLLVMGEIKSTKQTVIAEAFGIDTSAAHSAMGDVQIAIQIWEQFLLLYEKALSDAPEAA